MADTDLPEQWRAIFGTLAHNRSFTAREVAEYVHRDPDPARRKAATALPQLIKLGFVKATREPHHYFPTKKGWEWIEGTKAE